ncbi:MAG: TolC family protein, partial [Bryobacterales bacterium]|nr:TolC family protein [Bryobacterales bacterium]
ATDADVLSIQVHVATMQEQQIRAKLDADVAQAAFNEAVGAPLDNRWNLTTPLTVLATLSKDRAALEQQALSSRPDARQAGLAIELTDTQRRLARTGYFPQISVRALLEADRNKFVTQGGGNWFIAGGLRWNLFDGYRTRQQVKMAEAQLEAAKAGKRQLEAAVQLGVRRAHAEVNAAAERITVSQAAITQAEESLRITRNRYEAGLSTVTDLIRNEVALHEARLRRLMAIHDQRVAAAMLEYAAGNLQPDSEVLR